MDKVLHLGSVIIKGNIEIGVLNSVCIGVVDDTEIGEGVKIDNIVHIAHYYSVGNSCMLTASTELREKY
ncbi:hypothetical protein CJF42_10120 [Pseudoalteromonas sp. NBT06-2]|uniref:hypothetical protein n=1 Tax=Pseudoalteromonas sp. NBT06-2 TaxID=2025950 RepID=UPI000BA70870|nr:hypothetical protein [Pseudoalteromonas sp. NBT06-2]PAJ74459.1 hypothetical protein CJF42_10120 [Pseudoalteromonas sp. NBT06-2]